MHNYLERADWNLVPQHMQGAIRRYIEKGIPPGGFLTAVLANNLVEAINRADPINSENLKNTVMFLYHYAPAMSWGSPNAVQAWIVQGGLRGRELEKETSDG